MSQARQRLVTLEELTALLRDRRAAGERVVLTNGTFDILHVGHVRYLEAARAMGDILVVGINSDASARGYKGPGRPVVPQDERAEIVAALACVDYATIFDEPTAVHLVDSLHPDIYVKGGDYDGTKPLPEADAVRSYGGEVRIVPFVPGHSASEIIENVKRKT
jgi:D-beta-D-heptose 7-phosphate kinase/D-beta-D-heptose 1-phosphate adenosyltransferase